MTATCIGLVSAVPIGVVVALVVLRIEKWWDAR